MGLDESVTSKEEAAAMADVGGCSIAEIKLGPIRPMRNGLSNVWTQCPMAVVNKLVAMGKIGLGWSMVRVVPLRARPLQCFKC